LAVAIALPTLQGDLGAEPVEGQWVLTAYGLTFGSALLLGGSLGDSYGRRRVLVAGMVLFAVGSLLAGTAPSLPALIAGRALQGLGAAGAVPAALALIASLLPAGPQRSRALSMLAAMASLGVISGLLLGGIITDLLGWRWVFLLTAVPALGAALAAPLVLPEARADEPDRSPDFGGAVLVTVAMAALLFGLTRVERHGIASLVTAGPVLAGVTLLGGFVAWERRVRRPLIRFEILRVRSLRAAAIGVGLNAIAFTAIVYAGTLYLQTALGYSALQAGLALLPVDAVGFAVAILVGRRLTRRSPRTFLAGAFAVTTLALLWLARAPVPADYVTDVMAPLVVLGSSLSIAFVVLTQEAVAEIRAEDKGLAAGIFETANHLMGGAAGVAIYATVMAASAAHAGDASGFRAAFLTGAVMAAAGILAAPGARSKAQVRTAEADPQP
jgi:EmrB/QacA subfamily drug resistance transporter